MGILSWEEPRVFLEGGLEGGVNFFGSHFKEAHVSLQLNQLFDVIVIRILGRF